MEHGNIAFKVTYNDTNWSGVCSKKVAEYNFGNRVWCGVQSHFEENCQSACYAHPGVLNRNYSPCYDAIAQKELQFSPGYFHHGSKAGEPKQCKDAKVGKIALFTSKEQGAAEIERFIFAIGVIEVIDYNLDDNGNEEEIIRCHKDSAIQFSARFRPKYWDYYSNKKAPETIFWGSGLIRYVQDEEILSLLNRVANSPVYNNRMKEKAKKIIEQFI